MKKSEKHCERDYRYIKKSRIAENFIDTKKEQYCRSFYRYKIKAILQKIFIEMK